MAIKKVGSAISSEPAVGAAPSGGGETLPGMLPGGVTYAKPPDPEQAKPKTAEEQLVADNRDLYRAVALLGFETVKATDEGDTIKFLCRTSLEGRLLFSRLQMLLSKMPMVEVGKTYLIKGGQLVYGWYFRLKKSEKGIAQVATAIMERFPVPVTGAKIYGGNLPGKLLTQSNDVPPSTGAGVVPRTMLNSALRG